MATSIAICSGKGGVGKSNVTVNLAMVYQSLGKKVAILDADFGMANTHILMGVNP
jgi:flagellar biosynthesis protein FlhG